MRIHEVLIVPGLGHLGPGVYDCGNAVGSMIEVDLIDKYVASIADELDNAAIRHRIAPTRKAPGFTPAERLEGIYPHTLILHCRIGWTDKRGKTANNVSDVYYTPGARNLAQGMSEVFESWGNLYVYGHRVAKPEEDTEDTLLSIPGTWGVRLEPFRLNAPHALEYARWLDKLGRDIGRYVGDFCRGRADDAAIKIQGHLEPRSRGVVA